MPTPDAPLQTPAPGLDAPAGDAPGVLFLINDLNVGGAERVLLSYVNHLSAVRPTVVVLRPALDLLDELGSGVALATLTGSLPSDRAAPLPGLGSRRGQPQGRMLLETPGLIVSVFRLRRLARALRSSVISTFLNRAHTIALLAKALDPGLRVVLNIHEMLSDHLAIHFAPTERRLMRAFIRRAFPRADAIIAVSTGVRDDLVQHFGIPPDRITVMHNPLDVARIRRASDGAAASPGDHRPLIVAVGRLVRLKGFDVLIRAMAELQQRTQARLLIIGEGEERPELERLVTELGAGDYVQMPGARTNPWAAMSRADVVVVPSRSEAFPSVIGEALVLSRPVVAARCSPGVAEYLEEGRCGLLVPPDDVHALSEALVRLLSDDGLRARLSAQGMRRVIEFDLLGSVRRYESLILGVIGKATP